jgi:uncharacterized repeat protein (TIGR03803 family)
MFPDYPGAVRATILASFCGTACIGGASPAWAVPKGSETVLYTFSGNADGGEPRGTLIANKAGALFGTTLRGGNMSQCSGVGCGTVFMLTPPAAEQTVWSFTVLYTFNGAADGANPMGDLIMDASGNLYGTAKKGGSTNCGGFGCGAIFELSPPVQGATAWTFTDLHIFGGADGASPEAGLALDETGNLLGTTTQGGASNQGVVFRLDTPAPGSSVWSEEVLYSFSGGADGGHVSGPVTLDGLGNIYGTAAYGGSSGAGLVYQLVPPSAGATGWTQNVMYNLPGGANGGYPRGALSSDSAGNLYGTATNIAFMLSPQAGGTWNATTLHAFTTFADANIPLAGLTEIVYPSSAAFYGTGAYGARNSAGAIWKIVAPNATNPIWQESLLYDFTSGIDGGAPMGGLTAGRGGVLYGATMFGGNLSGCDAGCGVIYMITP